MERYETLDEALGTNSNTPFEEKYGKYIDFIGREDVEKCIPYTKEMISKALKNGDKHLNSLNIKTWSFAANNELRHKVGAKVRFISQAELVCMLKEAARTRNERIKTETKEAIVEKFNKFVEKHDKDYEKVSAMWKILDDLLEEHVLIKKYETSDPEYLKGFSPLSKDIDFLTDDDINELLKISGEDKNFVFKNGKLIERDDDEKDDIEEER